VHDFIRDAKGRLLVMKERSPDPRTVEPFPNAHEDITPGYDMNKKHWITLSPGESIGKTLVDELVTKSCLVVERLPRAHRLVDPTTYGRGGRS
jgi:predicted DNA-binding protein (MmcQ/YjbR family)